MFSLFSLAKSKRLFLFFLSFVIVAWGHPDVSPVLTVCSYAFGLALFWIFLFSLSEKKQRFWMSLFWFALVQGVQLSWLATPEYQGIYIYFVYLGLVLLLGLQWALFSFCFPKKPAFTGTQLLALAGVWTLFEWARLFFLSGFAWNPFGLTMTAYPIMEQLASLGGIFFLSFWACLVNLLVLAVVFKPKKKQIVFANAAFLFPFVFGFCHLQYHEKKKQGHQEISRVALVQTALFPHQKMFFQERANAFVHPLEQWRNIFSFLEKHQNVDLIVLPESALPFSAKRAIYDFDHAKIVLRLFFGEKDWSGLLKEPFAVQDEEQWFVTNLFFAQALAEGHDAEVVLGLDDTDSPEKHYNAAFHLKPRQKDVERYEKQVLLPLAEYLPFSILKPLVARYGITDSFSEGKEMKVFDGKVPLSVSICYEECFGHLLREGKQKGAKLFVNLSNDAWYPSSGLHLKHYIHGKVRATENGVSLVRACNTGVTVAVDSLGRTVAQLGKEKMEYQKGALVVDLPLYSYSTLYTLVGDYLIVSLSLFFLCLHMVVHRRKST